MHTMAFALTRPVRALLQHGAQRWARPKWRYGAATLRHTNGQHNAAFLSSGTADGPSKAESRHAQVVKLIPQLSSTRTFLEQISTLSDEQFETGRRFLEKWHVLNVELAARDMSSAEVDGMQLDFMRVAQFEPGAPVEELLDQLTLKSARLEARAAVRERAERAAKREKRTKLAARVGRGNGNAIWPLHRILADMGDMGLSKPTVDALQAKFGWTLSFSRAMHSGSYALRRWFEMAGVDTSPLKGQYQCLGQEAAGGMLLSAAVEDTDIAGVQRVMCTYADGSEPVATSLLMYAPIVHHASGKDGLQALGQLDGAALAAAQPTSEHDVALLAADIPGFMPQLLGAPPERTGKTIPVYSVPLVLTPPRIHLLLRIAEGMADSRGVQLTGVHGAGKSMLLQALSTILPVGHPCDMLYVQEAADVFYKRNTCAQQLAQGSGPLVDERAIGSITQFRQPTFSPSLKDNQAEVKKLWSDKANLGPYERSELDIWHDECGTNMQFALPATLERLDDKKGGVHCGRVVIFDEVNQVLKLMRTPDARAAKEAEGHKELPGVFSVLTRELPWRSRYPHQHFRIWASSPDGLRESVPEVSEYVFHELRPARFDHLAAILHAAPQFLQPRLARLKPDRKASCMTLEHAMYACRELCGNMRQVTLYAKQLADALDDTSTVAQLQSMWAKGEDTKLDGILESYVDLLVGRLVDSSANPKRLEWMHPWEDKPQDPKEHPDRLTAGYYDLAVMNASVGVRCEEYLKNGSYDLLGQTMITVINRAARDPRMKWDSQELKELFARIAMADSTRFTKDGATMENEVKKRLGLHALSPRMWKLDALPDVGSFEAPSSLKAKKGDWKLQLLLRANQNSTVNHKLPESLRTKLQSLLTRARHSSDDVWLPARTVLHSKRVPRVAHVVQSRANQRTRVDAEVVSLARSYLEKGGHMLISTAHHFPRADFVLLHNDGKRRSVTFLEVTISTLKAHAAGDPTLRLNDSLKDLARLTEWTFATGESEDGRRWIAGDREQIGLSESLDSSWAGQGRETLANFWLRLLGCPKRIVADLQPAPQGDESGAPAVAKDATHKKNAKGGKGAKNAKAGKSGKKAKDTSAGKLTISIEDAPEDQREHAVPTDVDAEWDISIVYVSGSKQQPDYGEYANLKCDFAYGVFRQDMDDALIAWVSAPPPEPAAEEGRCGD